ncbi:MAG TPA: ATP-binding domain-containing protein, partial [Halanaerobiales bacterium]|nr:ATP-binding domain-containing protein [Halanaerobiales bacterium]
GETVIFSNQLGAKTLLNRIKEIQPVIPGNILNEKNWNILLSVISGQSTFRKRDRQKSKDRKTKGGVKNIIKEELYKVDMQQEAIGKTIPPGPQRIRGIAGSGKTILLSQKAAHMHLKHPDWKIALIFFTRSLYDNTIKEVDKWVRRFSNGEMGYDPDMNKNLKIFHAWGEKNREGFYRMICEHHHYRPLSAGSSKLGDGPPNKKLILACKIFLEKQEQVNPVFDAVLIDEAQDLLVDDDDLKYRGKQPFFWLAYQSLKETGDSGEKRLIWAYDEAQSLNSLNVPTARELFGDQLRFRRMVSGFHKGSIRKSEVMNKCYRTPGPILVAAHALGMGLLRPGGMLRGYTTQEDWENIGYEIKEGSFRPGKKIVLHRPEENTPNKVPEFWVDPVINFNNYNTRKEELDHLADSIKNDINQHKLNPSRDILVIVLGDFREAFKLKIEAARHLMNKGVDIYIPKSLRNNELYPKYPDIDPDKFWNRGGVTITNIHRAKGNEAYMVYVIGLDKIAENEADFSLRNQLFVALTRTKGWLKVMGVGNFPFYNEFRDVLKSGNTFEFTFQRLLDEKVN